MQFNGFSWINRVVQLSPNLTLEHFHPPKEILHQFTHQECLSILPTPSPWQPLNSWCFYRCTHSEYFIWMETYNVQSFVTGFFHVTWCLQGLSRYLISVFDTFLLLNNTPLRRYTTFPFFINPLMGIWFISTKRLLWIVLL